jgi:hypothetical protein
MENQLEDNKTVTPRMSERVEAARTLWSKSLPTVPLPGQELFEKWVDRNRVTTLHAAIKATGQRIRLIQDNGGAMDLQWAVTFVADCLREVNRKQQSRLN